MVSGSKRGSPPTEAGPKSIDANPSKSKARNMEILEDALVVVSQRQI